MKKQEKPRPKSSSLRKSGPLQKKSIPVESIPKSINSTKQMVWLKYSEPTARLSEICKRFEQIRTKNMECVKTLSKYNDKHTINEKDVYLMNHVYNNRNLYDKISKSAIKTEEAENRLKCQKKNAPQKRDIISMNSRLKKLILTKKSAPSFEDLRKKVRSLSVGSNTSISEMSMDIGNMNEKQLLFLRRAINQRLETGVTNSRYSSSQGRKHSDLDSSGLEFQLVESPVTFKTSHIGNQTTLNRECQANLYESKLMENQSPTDYNKKNPYLQPVYARSLLRSRKEIENKSSHTPSSHLHEIWRPRDFPQTGVVNSNVLSTSASEEQIIQYIYSHMPQPQPSRQRFRENISLKNRQKANKQSSRY